MIHQLSTPRPSVLPNKSCFDISHDWEVLRDNFENVSKKTIPNATLEALGFYYSPLGYLEEEVPRFVKVTNKPELAIEPEDDN